MKSFLAIFCICFLGMQGCEAQAPSHGHVGHGSDPGHVLDQRESNPSALSWLQERLAETDASQMPFLQDQTGKQQAVLRSGVQVLSFIYTRCPDPRICPLTVRSIRTALQSLPEADRRQVSLVIVTLDPQYDTGAVLARYGATTGLAEHSGPLLLLTGAVPDVQQWADVFSIGGVMDGAADHASHGMHTLATFVLRDGVLLARLGGTTWAPSQLQSQVVDALRTSQYNQPATEIPTAGVRAPVHMQVSVTNQTGENQ